MVTFVTVKQDARHWPGTDSVSYTHLKESVQGRKNFWAPEERKKKKLRRTRPAQRAVSYTHLDVYKRQPIGASHSHDGAALVLVHVRILFLG